VHRPLRIVLHAAVGAILATTLLAGASNPARADTPGLPKSLAEAIAMERADALPDSKFYKAPSLDGSKPGDLLREAAFDGYAIPEGSRAIRILYHSLDANERDVVTSAVVLIPAGRPPAGGWPVIAWAHGTSGVAQQCAPSLAKDMVYGEEGLMPMVRAGFAVIATDYHGLGTTGPHQYVNKLAQARDVIYSIPAARAAVPSLARKWTAIGHSQGGIAMWGVAELQATLKDPDYLGAISVAGSGELRDTLTAMDQPSGFAAFYLVYMAYAIHALTPEFKASDMLVGKALGRYTAATTRGCWNYDYASFIGDHGGKVLKAGWTKHPAVQKFFDANVLGSKPMAGPFWVIAGEADETVPLAGVKASVAKACANGISLAFRSYPGLDHDPTMEQSTPDQLAWVRDRIAGKPFANECPVTTR
jgi:pimeloyl-ACP methyl ester carboxylesterase